MLDYINCTYMPVKIENNSTLKAPVDIEKLINSVFDSVPREHTIGITKVVIVDEITLDRRLQLATKDPQPILYHPKTPLNPAYIEIALARFLLKGEAFHKRLMARLNFRAQVAGALLATIGQHYHISFSHGMKKKRAPEAPVRTYAERNFVLWRDKHGGLRAKLLKPLRPYLERFERWLLRKMKETKR